MYNRAASLEILRWGFSQVPGVLFHYGHEMDLELEDIGVLSAIFYTYEHSKPLIQSGITLGQILKTCPVLNKAKLTKRVIRMEKLGIIAVTQTGKNSVDKSISLEPLYAKIETLIERDHANLDVKSTLMPNDSKVLQQYKKRVEQLELELAEHKSLVSSEQIIYNDVNYKKIADFISKKTGNLLSVKMASELKRWLDEMSFTSEFLLCMLELCFERNIFNPRDITRIARDLKEYSINTVEGLEIYFEKYVDTERNAIVRNRQFDPDIAEFGTFTGIDMSADARKNVYYKWRYDWGFSHIMIMKAGEIMCQRTRNGGLEYIDSVLHSWMTKEIRQPEDADKELQSFKSRQKQPKNTNQKKPANSEEPEYELYIPPNRLNEIVK